jgi:hypothetical protein
MKLADSPIYVNWRSHDDLPANSAALMRQLPPSRLSDKAACWRAAGMTFGAHEP